MVEEAGGLESLLEKTAECNRRHIGDGNCQLLTEFLTHFESASRLVVADMGHKLREDMMGEMERLLTEIAGLASSSVQKPGSSNAASACGGTSAANRILIKGYIKDQTNKDESSLSRPKVVEYLGQLLAEMDNPIKPHIEIEAAVKLANTTL